MNGIEYKFLSTESGFLLRFLSAGICGIYTMYAVVGINCTLSHIDKLLRKEWCECCNHTSVFLDENGDEVKKSMKVLLLGLNGKITYEYDMGSTTTVYIELLSISNDTSNKTNQKIIFRNTVNPVCKCKNPAIFIYEGQPLCSECSIDVEDSQMLAEIVNSPRTGICGYS